MRFTYPLNNEETEPNTFLNGFYTLDQNHQRSMITNKKETKEA